MGSATRASSYMTEGHVSRHGVRLIASHRMVLTWLGVDRSSRMAAG